MLELSKLTPPPAGSKGNGSPGTGEVRHPGRLVVTGLHPTDRLFVDQAQMPRPDSTGGWSVDAGLHHLKLMDGSQELIADSRQVKSDATVTLARSDFKAPAPPTSDEQVAWDRAEKSQDIGTVEGFLAKYPNSSRREQADSDLQNLYWLKATKTATATAYRDFLNRYPSAQGAHFDAANAELDRLDWQNLQNSSDVSQVSSFLARHPKGTYHDLAAGRFDDLAWNAAKATGNADGVRTYLRDYPGGRHRDEANNELTQLTPKPQQPRPPDNTGTHNPPPTADHSENDAAAIRRVLDAYQDAYESRSLDKLRAIWPTMSSSQADNLGRFFKGASDIRAPYSILNQNISGDDAKVAIQQFMALGGQKPHTAKMAILLKRRASGTPWFINSIE